jgi:glutamine amidotransferase
MKIVIINYGAGNIHIMFAIERLGCSNDWKEIKAADKVIFPGVETSSAMKMLIDSGLDVLIPTLKQPVLEFVWVCN